MTRAIPDPYDRTEFRSRPLDYATIALCLLAEERLGYQLTLLQGIGGAPASSGTHLDGRAVDAAPWDGTRKERVFRDLGGASWERAELPGVWGPHVHTINIFDVRSNQRGLAPAGFRQIGYYDRGLDGLADSARDPHPYRPSPPVVLTMARYTDAMRRLWLRDGGPQPTAVTEARDALVEADADLGRAAALLRPLGHDDVARDELDNIQRQRTRIRATLTRMPKR